ncbi:MAG: protein kinase [Gammaproteobacteria bacterium]
MVEPQNKPLIPVPGTQITSAVTGNTYTFGRRIGEGFFSDVYECRDVWNNELAVKVLKPLRPIEELRAAAVQEFQTLLTVRHPHITHVYDAFEFQSAFFIVTERCFGSLESLFRIENFNGMLWLMPIARCLLQAVHSLHIMGIAHQDIHLGNAMWALHKDEMVPDKEQLWHFKLCDLGIARLHTELAATELRKVSIMPPEVLDLSQFGPLDHRIDIYHLGLVLMQFAFSRRLEFTAEEILAGRPRELALTLAPPYSVALEKALRRHVIYRTASAMELWRDLNSPVGT